jgi:hypothetical protein
MQLLPGPPVRRLHCTVLLKCVQSEGTLLTTGTADFLADS